MAGIGALVSDTGRLSRLIGGTSALDSRRTGRGGGGGRRSMELLTGRASAAVALRSRPSDPGERGRSSDVDSDDVDVDVEGVEAIDAEYEEEVCEECDAEGAVDDEGGAACC